MENTNQIKESVKKRPPFLSSLSLRTSLVLGNMVIIAFAVIGSGYFVYSRTNLTNSYLVNQIDKNVLQQAEEKLNNTNLLHASDLNNFFVQMRRDITNVGATASSLLSQESILKNEAFWDATLALSRLPNGSWDNPNSEVSSIFIPASAELTPTIVNELDTIKQLDLTTPSILKQNPDVVAIYFGGTSRETIYYPNIDLAAIVPSNFDVTSRPWYVNASPQQNPDRKAVWSDPYLDAALHGLVVTASIPVYDTANHFRGVAAMDIQLKRITELVTNIQIGKTGYAMVINKDRRLIALPDSGYQDLGISSTDLPLGEILDPTKLSKVPAGLFTYFNNAASGENGIETLSMGGSQRFVAYAPISEVGYGILIIVPSNELMADAIAARQQVSQETRNTFSSTLLLVASVFIATLIITLLISNSLTSPLIKLTKTAEEITQGNLDAEASAQYRNEIGTLATAINSMTSSLRNMIQSLEKQVEERTRDLVRQTLHLQAASRVAHDAAELQDIQAVIQHTSELISSRFGYYHAGIFLLDETGERAILMAASSEGGKRMLARGHQLLVGAQGIVGAAAYQNKAHVVMNVAEDKDYYQNPDLPLTRSEAAFPLSARGRVLGVLDIQSTEETAFRKDDIDVLQTMADQIALAIQNAQSITESKDVLNRLETTALEKTHRSWKERLRGASQSYRYSSLGGTTSLQPEGILAIAEKTEQQMRIPISLRGQPIGTIILQRSQDNPWSETDRTLAQEIASQVGLALENARLLDEAQRRAAQESSLSEIASKLSRTLDPDILLQTVVRELHQLPNVSGVSVYLTPSKEAKSTGE